eukprot:m.147157 g.147157  ORF g.147157 m.147157 type:complete len:925 (-) comp16253_c0_seq2:1506-4280(-)
MFSGKAKAKRAISLGGARRQTDRTAAMQRARLERQHREAERQREAASHVLQRAVRCWLARLTVAAKAREEFDRLVVKNDAQALKLVKYFIYFGGSLTSQDESRLDAILTLTQVHQARIAGWLSEQRTQQALLRIVLATINLESATEARWHLLRSIMGLLPLSAWEQSAYLGMAVTNLARHWHQEQTQGVVQVLDILAHVPDAMALIIKLFLSQPDSQRVWTMATKHNLFSTSTTIILYDLSWDELVLFCEPLPPLLFDPSQAASDQSQRLLFLQALLLQLLASRTAHQVSPMETSLDESWAEADDVDLDDAALERDEKMRAFVAAILTQPAIEQLRKWSQSMGVTGPAAFATVVRAALDINTEMEVQVRVLSFLAVDRGFIGGLFQHVTDLTVGKTPESTLALLAQTCLHMFGVVDDHSFQQHVEQLFGWDTFAQFLRSLVLRLVDLFLAASSLAFAASPLAQLGTRFLRHLEQRDQRLTLYGPSFWIVPSLDAALTQALPKLTARTYDDQEALLEADGNAKRGAIRWGCVVQILQSMPFVFPFLSRVKVFRQLISTSARSDPGFGRRSFYNIRRASAYEDAFDQLGNLHAQLAHRFSVRIIAATGDPEEGIDGGGLFREFVQLALKAGFDPACGYFRSSSEQELYPDPDVEVHSPDFRLHYRFLGNLLGLAMRSDMLVELPFCRFFLSKLLGQRAGLQDLASLDPELFRNLVVVKDYTGDAADLGLDFTVTGNELTGRRVFDLVPNGSQLNVDNSNKIRYVYHMADFHLNKRLAAQTAAFAQGLYEMVSPPWLQLFGPLELQKLISGDSSGIDLSDLRQHVVYGHGFDEDHPTIALLWKVLHGFSTEELKALIAFITSCPRPPILGFGALQPKIGIWNSTDISRLPTASTCINQLKLPPYEDEDMLRTKLKQAIMGAQGFGLS